MFYKGQLLTYKRHEDCHSILPIFKVIKTKNSEYTPIVVINYHEARLIGTHHNLYSTILKPYLTIKEL